MLYMDIVPHPNNFLLLAKRLGVFFEKRVHQRSFAGSNSVSYFFYLFFVPVIPYFTGKLVHKKLMSQDQIVVNTDEVQTTQS